MDTGGRRTTSLPRRAHPEPPARGHAAVRGRHGRRVVAGRTVDDLESIHRAILDDPANAQATAAGVLPLYTASEGSRIAVIGQAPGKKAQDSGAPWNDQ